MVQNTNNNLEKKLNEFIGKNVTISQDGFLKNSYSTVCQSVGEAESGCKLLHGRSCRSANCQCTLQCGVLFEAKLCECL